MESYVCRESGMSWTGGWGDGGYFVVVLIFCPVSDT